MPCSWGWRCRQQPPPWGSLTPDSRTASHPAGTTKHAAKHFQLWVGMKDAGSAGLLACGRLCRHSTVDDQRSAAPWPKTSHMPASSTAKSTAGSSANSWHDSEPCHGPDHELCAGAGSPAVTSWWVMVLFQLPMSSRILATCTLQCQILPNHTVNACCMLLLLYCMH